MKTPSKTKSTSPIAHFLRQTAQFSLFLAIISLFSGCGDFFAEKATELESQNIIREISKIEYTPTTGVEVPDIYKMPPRIMEGTVGEIKDAKLFYFTRYNTPDALAKLINEQFVNVLYNAKGVASFKRDYNTSISSATNQLIVRCPSIADAEEVKAFLEQVDVPPIQIKIDCIISEVYADHTMDWETTIDIQNLFGTGMALGGKVGSGGDLLPAFPGAALRDIARSSFGLKTGFVMKEGIAGHEVKTLVDLLASRGYLKILMEPSLEVVNGKTATIQTEEKIPMDQITNVHQTSGLVTYSTKYESVIDSLEITPTVYGDGYIGIKTTAIIGSKSTPEGVKQVPIVTRREINIEENRIRPGESLVIGGITKTEKRSVVRGVPFLKDLPFIGILFSSKDFEERGKEVLFIITPTISTGGIPNKDLVDNLRRKHQMLKPETGIIQTLSDPLGQNYYTDLIEKEATKSETERIRAEIEKGHAERKAELLQKELEMATQRPQTQQEQIQKAKDLVDEQGTIRTKTTHESQIDEWMKKRAKIKAKTTPN